MVAPGQQARARRRAQRGRVEVREPHAATAPARRTSASRCRSRSNRAARSRRRRGRAPARWARRPAAPGPAATTGWRFASRRRSRLRIVGPWADSSAVGWVPAPFAPGGTCPCRRPEVVCERTDVAGVWMWVRKDARVAPALARLARAHRCRRNRRDPRRGRRRARATETAADRLAARARPPRSGRSRTCPRR